MGITIEKYRLVSITVLQSKRQPNLQIKTLFWRHLHVKYCKSKISFGEAQTNFYIVFGVIYM